MEFEALAWGYGLVEGPRVDARGNLYFSDVLNGGVYVLDPSGSVRTVVPKRRGVGGIALHADAGLVISGKNVCHVREGKTRVLFGRDDIPGFNDLFTDAAGRIYVGSLRSDAFGSERIPGELWRIDGEGKAVELYGGVELTNGIGFSPDGLRLYHSDSSVRRIHMHEVDANGNVRNRSVFAEIEVGFPDGLAVDAEGGVWVASYGGSAVLRYTPEGKLDRTVPVPARDVTSLCFGGADLCDLYVVSADNTDDPDRKGTIFRARSDVAGLPAPLARI